MTRGNLFVVTGPSGVGKGTVLKRVRTERDKIYYSVSATTRNPREGEVDGVNYFFVTKDEFQNWIDQGRMLEHACYVGNYYGTPEKPVQEHLDRGEDVILEIELQGALNVKAKRPDAITVFIAPPSMAELEDRLRGRGTEAEETIAKRMATARTECDHVSEFRYVVVNDDLEKAIDDLKSIIKACRCFNDGHVIE